MGTYDKFLQDNPIKKGLDYVKYNGFSGVLSKVRSRMTGPGLAYNGWYREKHEPDEEELTRQREDMLAYSPLISILVPVYLTPEFFLRGMIESVQNQTYSNFELCVVDGSRARVTELPDANKTAYDVVYSLETERIIREYAEDDERIRYHLLEENQGICGSLNKALSMCEGEYVVLLNHDDLLTEDALYEIVKALSEYKYSMIYSDEDKCSTDATKFSDPSLKPDFSLDMLRSYHYMGHVICVEAELAKKVCFRRDFEGAEDYDFCLRCVEECVSYTSNNSLDTTKVGHIARVLYHSRIKNAKMDNSGHKKDLSKEIAKKALAEHLERSVGYAVATRCEQREYFKVVYETPGNPYISIIIEGVPNPEYMDNWLLPLYEKTRYSNFEVIIVDTNPDDKIMSLYYRRLEERRKNISVVAYTGEKKIAAYRNCGAGKAKGKLLLFLDIGVSNLLPTSLGEMVGNCMRKEVAIVGGTILNEQGTIKRQGIIIGANGVFDYVNKGLKKGNYGYLMSNVINCNYSAVSASCMMVKTSVYDKIGGFDTTLKGELSDVDFCLKARELGMLVVSLADSLWLMDKSVRDKSMYTFDVVEQAPFINRWQFILDKDDPYYNSNFTREGELYSLKP